MAEAPDYKKLPLMVLLLAAMGLCFSTVHAAELRYQEDVQPIFDRYCIACHACYDAPCQLDLTRPEGVRRGAHKKPVYQGTRLKEAAPTRLGIDGRNESDWRDLGFFSVLQPEGDHAPVLQQLLNAKTTQNWKAYLSDSEPLNAGIRRKNFCPMGDEVTGWLEKNPHAGMPFALPPITPADLAILNQWLAEGASTSSSSQRPGAEDRKRIARWEAWLNADDPRRKLVARWLFEHWAFARLHFDEVRNGAFYRLVRSRTGPGEPVDEIATRLPNEPPGGPFWYRFQLQTGKPIYKTQIRFPLNAALLQRIESLFLSRDWQAGEPPGYSSEWRANPFRVFRDIPAEARYRFMLEHAEYFVRTFIRGPVCRGQLATDVIRDHFWVMFQDPDSDLYVQYPEMRAEADELLALPAVDQDLFDGAKDWIKALRARNRYMDLRQHWVNRQGRTGASLAAIWDGDGKNKNALLTVFRHHDSATVRRGWLGQQPLTVWWMDYPLFERSYYNLVANFDVFGSVSHQLQTRLYFDLIRNGAELNFLRLIPPEARKSLLGEWYRGTGKIKTWVTYEEMDVHHDTGFDLRSDQPKEELLDDLLETFASINHTPDRLNRPRGRLQPDHALLSRISGVPAAELRAIRFLPEASILLVREAGRVHSLYTLVRNRRHTNVAFVLGERLRYEPEKDQLTVVPGIATGYPNFIFEVSRTELANFLDALTDEKNGNEESFIRNVISSWGVRRTSDRVWPAFHDMNDWLARNDPLEFGVLDLNRYVDYR